MFLCGQHINYCLMLVTFIKIKGEKQNVSEKFSFLILICKAELKNH